MFNGTLHVLNNTTSDDIFSRINQIGIILLIVLFLLIVLLIDRYFRQKCSGSSDDVTEFV